MRYGLYYLIIGFVLAGLIFVYLYRKYLLLCREILEEDPNAEIAKGGDILGISVISLAIFALWLPLLSGYLGIKAKNSLRKFLS